MLRVALLCATALVLFAAPAHAAGTLSKSGATLVLQLDGADDVVHMGSSGPIVVVQDASVTSVAPCVASPAGAACSTSGITAITVDGAGGNDLLSAQPALSPVGQSALGPISLPVTMTGDAGNDTLIGGAFADNLSGGDGNDALFGSAGVDTLNGDAGDDYLEGDAGPDHLIGGDGTDTASWAPSTTPVTVTLDGQPNDGAGGEGDDAEVENIIGGHGDDTLTGDANSNVIEGGDGSDLIDGGAGADQLFGEDGLDTIRAQDGFVDRVDCGGGLDGVTGDDFDIVENCETDTHSSVLQPPPIVRIAPPPAPALQVFDTAIVGRYTAGSKSTSIHELEITHLQTKAKVTVTCKAGGKSCPFKGARSFSATRATFDVRKALKLKTVKPGVVLAIVLSSGDHITRTTTVTFSKRKTPKLSVSCARPASTKRIACP
jgi:hypothetical protein